jgi:serine/threonine-protein kinase
LVARFEREALAAAGLNHPNVVAVYDSGQAGGTRFIVMECVAGKNLAQLVRERGPLTADEVAEIGSQTAGAIAAAHNAGIIHRDIKPANVMIDQRGIVKVLDFGIARGGAEHDPDAHRAGDRIGVLPRARGDAPARHRPAAPASRRRRERPRSVRRPRRADARQRTRR